MVKLSKPLLLFFLEAHRTASLMTGCRLLALMLSLIVICSQNNLFANALPFHQISDNFLFDKKIGLEKSTLPKSEVLVVDAVGKTSSSFYFQNKIDAIGTGHDSWLSVGFDNLSVSNFIYSENKLRTISIVEIRGKSAMAKLEDNTIMALQPVPDKKYFVVGYKYGMTIYDIMDGELRAGIGNRYRSTSQVDLVSYGDIVVYKQDIAQKSDYGVEDAYTKGYVSCKDFNMNTKRFNKKSKLLRAKRRNIKNITGNPGEIYQLDIMQNPSGFTVANSKNLICTFDARGQLQVLDVRKLELILDTNIEAEIANAWFLSDKKIVLMLKSGGILAYDIKKKESVLLRSDDDQTSFVTNSGFNGKNLIGYITGNELFVYDIFISEIIHKQTIKTEKSEVKALQFLWNSNTVYIAINY